MNKHQLAALGLPVKVTTSGGWYLFTYNGSSGRMRTLAEVTQAIRAKIKASTSTPWYVHDTPAETAARSATLEE